MSQLRDSVTLIFSKSRCTKGSLTQEITAVLRATNSTVSESTDIYNDSLFSHRRMCHILGNHQQY
jgi:hypothetical protein